ncbi:putative NAD(P)H quinone oxidoreductase, PIG3 family [Brachybacterium faecium DSM 4810]|uniref:Putative NAD(P)H quinone oxidoreductase, PIG3 family n=1 Tax=Brachybacterium faecium (strain ATCC 43885 / DSM 4810 / JCM 11609 / LMG 19847 / NBRC 14762 / NCIMB 9860 / 6-10) TaxID=446465 RepID=C7MIC1_BRAFD|nr:putative NAD(P)H quinone oxidoreductase, PIG3 family [Brachybacterium faecium DSM 4810]
MTMRAMTITEDHRLELAELPEPVPAPGEVLVDVVAAGVNRADVAQTAGKYPPPPGASELPGLEISGRRRDTGEAVVALLAGGGYAEVVAVPEDQLLPLPDGADPVDAAGVVEVAATVVSNLVLEAGLAEGETVLIHGGTGGIGTFAIQLARQLGARVLTTVGSDEAIPTVRELGADMAWNRHTTDLLEAVRETGGADVILDVVGGPTLGDNVSMLREHGRLVIIGTLGGASGELPIGLLMGKRARVIGTTLRSRPTEGKRTILEATHELVWPLLASGALRLPVHRRLPLERAAEAHAILREGGHLGKVLLEVGPANP